jgi:hypothetical protein
LIKPKPGVENALKTKPEGMFEHYQTQLKVLQEAYGEAMLELRARKKWDALLAKKVEA